jgi:signal peptidase II
MNRAIIGYAVALVIFILDQLTKWLMIGPLALQQARQIYVMPIFNLTWTENYGISLGRCCN